MGLLLLIEQNLISILHHCFPFHKLNIKIFLSPKYTLIKGSANKDTYKKYIYIYKLSNVRTDYMKLSGLTFDLPSWKIRIKLNFISKKYLDIERSLSKSYTGYIFAHWLINVRSLTNSTLIWEKKNNITCKNEIREYSFKLCILFVRGEVGFWDLRCEIVINVTFIILE